MSGAAKNIDRALGLNFKEKAEKAARIQGEITGEKRAIERQTSVLEKQQTAEIDQRRRKLNQQAISVLRARFGGGSRGIAVGGDATQQTPGNLFSAITGRS